MNVILTNILSRTVSEL